MNTKVIAFKSIQDIVKEIQQFYLFDNDLAHEDENRVLKMVSGLDEWVGDTKEISKTVQNILTHYVQFVDVSDEEVERFKEQMIVQLIAIDVKEEGDTVFAEAITCNKKVFDSRDLVISEGKALIVEYMHEGRPVFLDMEGMPISINENNSLNESNTYHVGKIVV